MADTNQNDINLRELVNHPIVGGYLTVALGSVAMGAAAQGADVMGLSEGVEDTLRYASAMGHGGVGVLVGGAYGVVAHYVGELFDGVADFVRGFFDYSLFIKYEAPGAKQLRLASSVVMGAVVFGVAGAAVGGLETVVGTGLYEATEAVVEDVQGFYLE